MCVFGWGVEKKWKMLDAKCVGFIYLLGMSSVFVGNVLWMNSVSVKDIWIWNVLNDCLKLRGFKLFFYYYYSLLFIAMGEIVWTLFLQLLYTIQ